jgi:pimeloyl-ACP methyl ester carboxylesterase
MSATCPAAARFLSFRFLVRVGWWSVWLLVAAIGLSTLASAQEKPKAGGKAAADEEEPLPDPVEIKLPTKDGVIIKGTYYGSNLGKKAAVVVLLHSFKGEAKGDRKDFGNLAPLLQQQGFAVVAPDLRGHGESTEQIAGNLPVKLDAARLGPDDFKDMYIQDMEAIRSFLVRENDDEKLNLNALGLVGSEMGASVAFHFAGYNNLFLPRVEPNLKRMPSPDVKALVLVSPPQSFPVSLSILKGLQTYPPMKSEMPMLILVGEGESKTLKDANALVRIVKPLHKGEGPNADFFFGKMETKLQGGQLITAKGLDVDKAIARFLQIRLQKPAFPWRQRRMSD